MTVKIIIIVLAVVFLFCFMWVNRYQITPKPDGGVYRHDRWTGNIDYILDLDILVSRGQKSSLDFGSIEKEEPKKTIEEILGPRPNSDKK